MFFKVRALQSNFTFLTPALPQDLDVLSRPVTYVTWRVDASDGREHQVELYFDLSR